MTHPGTSKSYRVVLVGNNGLRWGVKNSFVAYVEKMRDGAVFVADGATRLDDGAFYFPFQDETHTERGSVRRFLGAVHFTGHSGMLAVNLSGIEVTETSAGAVLSIADELSPQGRLTLVQLGEAEEGVTSSGVTYPAPVLTDEGADLFFENYPAGTAFDAVTLPVP